MLRPLRGALLSEDCEKMAETSRKILNYSRPRLLFYVHHFHLALWMVSSLQVLLGDSDSLVKCDLTCYASHVVFF